MPLAKGSNAPVCPAFLAKNKRLTFCKAALELNPVSLSSRIMPLMSLPFALRLDTSQI
jgi:hypothetical protein